MNIADPNKTILTGENPFIRLSLKDGDPNSTDASYFGGKRTWRSDELAANRETLIPKRVTQ